MNDNLEVKTKNETVHNYEKALALMTHPQQEEIKFFVVIFNSSFSGLR